MPETTAAAVISLADGLFLRRLLREKAAIEVGAHRDYLLSARLAPVAAEHGLDSIAELVRHLRLRRPEMEAAVIDAMTTNETSFFRDPSVFSDLRTDVIPELAQTASAKRPFTIWSAGCSSGQEIYSVAIMLHQHFPELIQAHAVRLLATDISATMVDRCHEGLYSRQEVARGLEPELRARYFEPDGDRLRVRRTLRDLVFSRQINLIKSFEMVPRCDLILLRNVLIYFRDEARISILERLHTQVLKQHGVLVLGATETIANVDVGYDTVHLPQGMAYTPRSSSAF